MFYVSIFNVSLFRFWILFRRNHHYLNNTTWPVITSSSTSFVTVIFCIFFFWTFLASFWKIVGSLMCTETARPKSLSVLVLRICIKLSILNLLKNSIVNKILYRRKMHFCLEELLYLGTSGLGLQSVFSTKMTPFQPLNVICYCNMTILFISFCFSWFPVLP